MQMIEAIPPELAASPQAAEAHRRLNGTDAAYPHQADILTLFLRQVLERPDAPAVVHQGHALSYAELDTLSRVLAARLEAAGVQHGDFVGVCHERSPALIAALIAVLRRGAAYLPFSAQWPDARLMELITQCRCCVVLTDRPERMSERLAGVRCVPTAGAQGGAEAPADDSRPPGPDTVAYVNFTSGSTGRPKGVPILHRAVVNLVSAAVYADLGPHARVLHLAPVTFDAATFEIWGALLTGGVCVLYPSPFIRFSELKRVIDEERVTTVWLATALFNSLVDETPQALDGVARIVTGGEAHSLRHIAAAFKRYGPDRLTNGYGPTECTTFATFHPIDEPPDPQTPLPIGTPIQNTRAYVVDGERLCGPGEAGEVLLAGPGLSPGYLGLPEETAKRFVERRIAGRDERLYRTGDLAHLSEDGTLVFLGRRDDQVKINGFRVEPGEIDHLLSAHPAVRRSFVTAGEGPGGQRVLIAFVTPVSDECTEHALRGYLAERLPSYAIPAAILRRDRLPLNANGKIDRDALLSAARLSAQPNGPARTESPR